MNDKAILRQFLYFFRWSFFRRIKTTKVTDDSFCIQWQLFITTKILKSFFLAKTHLDFIPEQITKSTWNVIKTSSSFDLQVKKIPLVSRFISSPLSNLCNVIRLAPFNLFLTFIYCGHFRCRWWWWFRFLLFSFKVPEMPGADDRIIGFDFWLWSKNEPNLVTFRLSSFSTL
jgi:hypothetical protein